ncbi:hypothetical protein GGI15_004707 [Coemansia interrupta]|uniref:Derlin n=1 Tax=Coemansia interrupta TaxID=1126814 RepID=A0A9W8LES8_9FUNG|nr:hypothetical protein GGI15_004707 [Coemansia interrupta]
MPSPLEDWYYHIPVCTRVYMTAIFALTLAEQLDIVPATKLYYTPSRAFSRQEYWRLLTSFLYLGRFSFEWFLNMYFIVQYCRDLEEGSYLNRPADFCWLLVLLCSAILLVASLVSNPYFLAHMLVASLTYMWSRFYSHIFISFMGLLTMPAAYFPWVMLAFSLVIEPGWPVFELLAIAIGHVFWFLAEEWPRRAESAGVTPLAAPAFLCRLLNQTTAAEDEDRLAELGIDMAVFDDGTQPGARDPPPLYTEQAVPEQPAQQPEAPSRQSEESQDHPDDKETQLRQRSVRTDIVELD